MPEGFWNALAQVTSPIWNLLPDWLKHKTEHNKRIAPLMMIVRDTHQELLYAPKVNADELEKNLNKLEKSDPILWMSDDAHLALKDFLYHARNALRVRKNFGDYRNEIEMSQTQEYLDNAKERIIAALRKRKIPPAFYPD